MALTQDRGRQTALYAVQKYTYADLDDGVITTAVDLPGGAIILSGALVVTTAFDAATSAAMEIGDGTTTDSLLTSTTVKATGDTAFTGMTGAPLAAPGVVSVELTSVGTNTQGAGYVRVEYLIEDRANEVQP